MVSLARTRRRGSTQNEKGQDRSISFLRERRYKSARSVQAAAAEKNKERIVTKCQHPGVRRRTYSS
jgi:hypothetical protein